MDNDAANATRCQDRAGTYEAWYVTVADPASGRGFWIRYTTFNPAPGVAVEPHSALWAFAFDRHHPEANWGGKVMFPLRAMQTSSQPFRLRLEGASVERDGCSGQIHTERGSAKWDLSWVSRVPPFPFLRPRWQGLSSVANIGAHPALTVSGTVEINGELHRLDGAPGGQQHTWGTSHALAWNWGFASGADFWVDGATSRVRSRLGRVIAGTALGVQSGSHRFLFNGPVQVLRNRSTVLPSVWQAVAQLGDRSATVVIRPRVEDLLGVTYPDPRGGSRYCYHTEVADLELRLTRRGETLAEMVRPGAAAFEYASETPVAGIPLVV
ncbi:MAG TPA: hypothetical protein VG426_14055 [Candidatus Dormibacteraeota bacterium]|nr:hypothetical protein [Candidatus Dormibacteraeota bacterium]